MCESEDDKEGAAGCVCRYGFIMCLQGLPALFIPDSFVLSLVSRCAIEQMCLLTKLLVQAHEVVYSLRRQLTPLFLNNHH